VIIIIEHCSTGAYTVHVCHQLSRSNVKVKCAHFIRLVETTEITYITCKQPSGFQNPGNVSGVSLEDGRGPCPVLLCGKVPEGQAAYKVTEMPQLTCCCSPTVDYLRM